VILWRVSNFANLDGVGGLHVAGRWHSKGRPVLYCTRNPSTALLETLVHIDIDAEDRPNCFQVLKIAGPDSLPLQKLSRRSLPAGWEQNNLLTQRIGDRWLAVRRTLLLEVPSVLAPETWNVLVNPLHPQIRKLRIAALYEHPFDARFFS
jgi:RES domain-containing protein